MVKNFILFLCLTFLSIPVLADELLINKTPAQQFSGVNNTARPKYPALYRAKSVVDMEYEDEMSELDDNDRDVVTIKKEIKKNPASNKITPMNYSSFPQNYDSSNSMMMMPGGMQGMFNQVGY